MKLEANKEFMENLSYSCQLGVERIQINYKSKTKLPGGGGDSAYEMGGDARRKFWIKPIKETDLGGAQAFFGP